MPRYSVQMPTATEDVERMQRQKADIALQAREKELAMTEPYNIRAEERQFSLRDGLEKAREVRKVAQDEEKRIREQGRQEKMIASFFKANMGRGLTTKTGVDYTLDTPEEAIEAYKQAGNTPSKEFIDQVYKIKWPEGGVNELARKRLTEPPKGYRAKEYDPTGAAVGYEPIPQGKVSPYGQEALDFAKQKALAIARAKEGSAPTKYSQEQQAKESAFIGYIAMGYFPGEEENIPLSTQEEAFSIAVGMGLDTNDPDIKEAILKLPLKGEGERETVPSWWRHKKYEKKVTKKVSPYGTERFKKGKGKPLPRGITEADIQFTMKEEKLTRNEVLKRLGY